MKSPHVVLLCCCQLCATTLPASVRYVDVNNTNPMSPYTEWSIAATNIQDAIDVSVKGDLIWVTNGVYQSGGRLVSGLTTTNRVAITQAVTVESVNGPAVTTIVGYQLPTTNGANAVRCVYMTNGSALIGFTITNGATGSTVDNGGGVYFQTLSPTTSVLSNCIVVGNAAGSMGGGINGGGKVFNCSLSNNWARQYGGGANGAVLVACVLKGNFAGVNGGGSGGGVLTNCLLAQNVAKQGGGGSYADALYNCTVVGNSVSGTNSTYFGGGTYNASAVENCIVYFNTAPAGSNYFDSPMTYCCTAPTAAGLGNITNPPAFVDLTGGDYHLHSLISPCINSDNNAYVTTATDFDGNPRISGGTVDIGAYEFQDPPSIISYAWLQQYGLLTDGFDDFTDPDGDGMNNWQEWICGTDPINPASLLKMLPPTVSGSAVVVSWLSVTNRNYFLQRVTSAPHPAFLTIATNISGHLGSTTFTDTNAAPEPFFYRVGVHQ